MIWHCCHLSVIRLWYTDYFERKRLSEDRRLHAVIQVKFTAAGFCPTFFRTLKIYAPRACLFSVIRPWGISRTWRPKEKNRYLFSIVTVRQGSAPRPAMKRHHESRLPGDRKFAIRASMY